MVSAGKILLERKLGIRPANVGSNIVGSWRLDEGAGTDILDSSGNGLHGTLVGGANSWAATDLFGRNTPALILGADGYVNLGDNNAFSFGNGSTDSPFSVELWCDLTGIDSAGAFLSKYNATTAAKEWCLFIYGGANIGRIDWACTDESTEGFRGRITVNGFTNPISLGNKYHVVGTYDGSGLVGGFAIYVNGVRVDSANQSSGTYVAMENTSAPCLIGAYTGGASAIQDIQGTLSNATIFNEVLSAETVLQRYQAGLIRQENILIDDVYQLVDEVVLGSVVDIVDFPSVLNGELDGAYRIEVLHVSGGTNPALSLRVNGAATTSVRSYVRQSSPTVSGAYASSGVFSQIPTSGTSMTVIDFLSPKASATRARTFLAQSSHFGTDANLVGTATQAFALSVPASIVEITRLGVASHVTKGLGAGTILRLYKTNFTHDV